MSVSVCEYERHHSNKVNKNPAQIHEAKMDRCWFQSVKQREAKVTFMSSEQRPRGHFADNGGIHNKDACNSTHQLRRHEITTSRGGDESINHMFLCCMVFFFAFF